MRQLFIGIAIPPIQASVIQLLQKEAQAYLGERTDTLSHGKSPLHITLVPPFVTTSTEEDARVEQRLRLFQRRASPYHVRLHRIGAFEPHTVYLEIEAFDRPFIALTRELLLRELELKGRRPFHPHVSLARKFDEARFQEVYGAATRAYEQYAERFPLLVRVSSVQLFHKEREDGRWSVSTSYSFDEGAVAA